MPTIALITPFLLLALFGSLHCMGMCGGFALAAGSGSAGPARQSLQLALYVLAKALCYAILGLSVSLLTHSTSHLAGGDAAAPERLDDLRRVFAWSAGAVIVLCGLSAMGARLPRAPGPLLRVLAVVRPIWNGIFGLTPLSRGFGIGLATGLLPCGLSWSALALATQVDPATAGVGMFLFGLGTGPALTAVGLARWIAPPRARRAGRILIGPALILLGLFTVARGGFPFVGSSVVPECCRPAGSEGAPTGSPGGR